MCSVPTGLLMIGTYISKLIFATAAKKKQTKHLHHNKSRMRLAHVKTNDNSSPRGAVRSVLIGEHYLCQLYCSVYKSCSSVGLQAKVKI